MSLATDLTDWFISLWKTVPHTHSVAGYQLGVEAVFGPDMDQAEAAAGLSLKAWQTEFSEWPWKVSGEVHVFIHCEAALSWLDGWQVNLLITHGLMSYVYSWVWIPCFGPSVKITCLQYSMCGYADRPFVTVSKRPVRPHICGIIVSKVQYNTKYWQDCHTIWEEYSWSAKVYFVLPQFHTEPKTSETFNGCSGCTSRNISFTVVQLSIH